MKYPGGKNAPGVCQRIISQIPRHRVFVELFGGSAAITRHILPAERNLVIDSDRSTVARFRDRIRALQPHAEYQHGDAFRWLATTDVEPDWCIYCDPPYHPETLRCEQKYACKFSAEDHTRLLAMLLALPCAVLISGYGHPLYDVTLRSWRRIGYWTWDRRNNRRSESLWMNFPRPTLLHDPRYVGGNRRQRETRTRRIRTFAGKIRRSDLHELQCLAGELDAEMRRRRLEYSDAVFADAVRDAGSGAASSFITSRVNGRHFQDLDRLSTKSAASAEAAVTSQRPRRDLVLSLFPGIDLLGQAFREAGFCVVSGPEKILGQDVADFVGAAGRVDGIIGRPPCQDFSALNRAKNGRARHEVLSTYGAEMLRHYLRIVSECRPTWWLLENVPSVPDVAIDGYQVQRLAMTDVECGGVQRRNRHFQFGHISGWIIRPERVTEPGTVTAPAALASDGKRSVRSYPAHCRLQGLDRPVTLPGWSRAAKFAAVGNGVPLAMGRVIARAVALAGPRDDAADCVCGCGRRITPPARHATATCRKVMERRRRGERPAIAVTDRGEPA